MSSAEWFRLSVNEAKSDPVGLWEMVKVGRHGFGLESKELDGFVKDFIAEMLKSGALVVVGNKSAKFGWSQTDQYKGDADAIAESIVSEWRAALVDPDINGIWFACPSAYT